MTFSAAHVLVVLFVIVLDSAAAACFKKQPFCNTNTAVTRYPEKTWTCVKSAILPDKVAPPTGGCCHYCSNGLLCDQDAASAELFADFDGKVISYAQNDVEAISARICKGKYPKGEKILTAEEVQEELEEEFLKPEEVEGSVENSTGFALKRQLFQNKSVSLPFTVRSALFSQRVLSLRQLSDDCEFCSDDEDVNSKTGVCLGVSTRLDSISWMARAEQAGHALMHHPLERNMQHRVLCWEPDANNRLCATPKHIVSVDAGHETMESLCRRVTCTKAVEEVGNFWSPNHDEEICGTAFCVTQKVDNVVHRALSDLEECGIFGGYGLTSGTATNALWKLLRFAHF